MHPESRLARLNPVIRFLVSAFLAAAAAGAQAPRIGEINYYGLRKVSSDRILSTLGIHAGDVLPPSKGDLEEKLTELPGVVDARVEAVCCQGSKTALFIGIEERGDAHFDTRTPPAGSSTLPDELLTQYGDYLAAMARGRGGEMRRLEDAFSLFATTEWTLLDDVLRNSSEPGHRAAAATVVAFAPKKTDAVTDLQYALQDPEEAVRASAVRSLKALAIDAKKDPKLAYKIAPVWLVEMLNSVVLGDRVIASQTLVLLTDQPNQEALDLMRDRATPALIDMARWNTLEYALPAFLLLGRTAGVPETQLQDQWSKGDRETLIKRVASKR